MHALSLVAWHLEKEAILRPHTSSTTYFYHVYSIFRKLWLWHWAHHVYW